MTLPGDVVAISPDGPVVAVRHPNLGTPLVASRTVAIPAGPGRARLRASLESLATTGHPGFLRVIDVTDVDDAHVEVRTAIPAAPTLAEVLRGGALPAAAVRGLLEELAYVLRAAHRAGVCHGGLVAAEVHVSHEAPGAAPTVVLAGTGLAAHRAPTLTTPARTPTPAHDVAALGELGLRLLGDGPGRTPRATTGSVDGALHALCRLAVDGEVDLTTFRDGVTSCVPPVAPPPPAVLPPAPHHPPTTARPRPRRRHRPPAAVAGVVLLGITTGAIGSLLGSSGAPSTVPNVAGGAVSPDACPDPHPTATTDLAADVDGDGCVEVLRWDEARAELSWASADGPARLRIGRAGDLVVVGDWDCDGRATVGLVRPTSGETHLFDGWAAAGETLEARAGPTLAPGAVPTVTSTDGCDEIVEAASDRDGAVVPR